MPERAAASRWVFAAVVAGTVVALILPFTAGDGAARLQDRHSEPRAEAAVQTVAVTAAGKLYHDPRCRFIHGPAVLEPVSQAVAERRSPCPRCLGVLREEPVDRRSRASSLGYRPDNQ